MKKLVLIIALIFVLISACVSQTLPEIEKKEEAPLQEKPLGQFPSGKLCRDNICDEFEKKEGTCPEDCKNVEGWQEKVQTEKPPQQEEKVLVTAIDSKYKSAITKPSGWFKTGEDADILLFGIDFNNAGGPLLFNNPAGLASDGKRLILTDRNNNRVLIWNNLPTNNTPPDIVLGQNDFTANNPGRGLDQMNWPVAVSTDGKYLVVADTENDRILIWNPFPTKNAQPADIVINNNPYSQDRTKRIQWPWGIWTNGQKLVVSNTASGTVLIWNTFPTQNDQPADIYLTGQGKIGTPRTVTSDGKHLIIGDHNPKVETTKVQGSFFWKEFPTKNEQEPSFFMAAPLGTAGWLKGDFSSDEKLIMQGAGLYVWNTFPENSDDKPDLIVGRWAPGGNAYWFKSTEGSGLKVIGNKLYLISNNALVGYNSIPTEPSSAPDFAIGAPDIHTNKIEKEYWIGNPVPATDGKSLFVSSDASKKLSVWKNLPDENNAHPDFIYDLNFQPWDSELFENTFVLAGEDTVYIWSKLPTNGELPDKQFKRGIGNVIFQNLRGVALDSKYFYLSDRGANKIYIWEGLPENNTSPKFQIDIQLPTRLSSDGKYLVATATEAGAKERINFYRVNELSSNSQPILLTGVAVNLPESALATQGHLFIADTGFNRVLVWNSIEDAINSKSPDAVIGENSLEDFTPEIGRNKLFWPAALAFDGSYLWVGEFKFSGRLLRFSVR